MIKIQVPTPLRRFTGGQGTVEVAGATVGEAIQALAAQFPEVGKNILGPDGQPRNFVNVYLGDEDVRHLQGLATAVAAGQTVLIVPSIAGGRA